MIVKFYRCSSELVYATKLKMNKMRRDVFAPLDIIWKTSSGKDCSFE